ncbi:MAG TPA: hypothetical protein VMM60_10320 [Ilumatobacter sp.]|nr:hypothetical protein [Ilumatobacter sp.]
MALVAVAGSGALAFAGWRTLSTSTAGKRVTVDQFVNANQRLPYTPTAVIGTANEDGRLTSVVVAVIEPDGTGGSLVELSASADTNLGLSDERRPLAATYEMEGPEAFLTGVTSLTTLAFDVVEIVDAGRFAELTAPLGELTVDVPVDVADEETGQNWAAGVARLAPAEAAALVTASSTQLDDWYYDSTRQAVWSAVADRVGAGIGTADPVASDDQLPLITDLDAFLDRLFAGPVEFRSLALQPYSPEVIHEQLPEDLWQAFGIPSIDSVVLHSRGEAALVFATVAPGRVGSPREGERFRVLWGFSEADLEELGINGADATIQAIRRLLFVGGNIISVARIDPSVVPDRTIVAVPQGDVLPTLEEGYVGLFGPVDLRAREIEISGIDVEITLGREFLDQLDIDAIRADAESLTTPTASTTVPDDESDTTDTTDPDDE